MNKITEHPVINTQGSFLNETMQGIDESIEKMYDGEKIKW